jgi:hypothetical protein
MLDDKEKNPTRPARRAVFRGLVNKYNSSDDEAERTRLVLKMAWQLKVSREKGFSIDEIVNGNSYPATVVNPLVDDPDLTEMIVPLAVAITDLTEYATQAVDTSKNVVRGLGGSCVYVYGYSCLPEYIKIGMTNGDASSRIADQISPGTPGRPLLFLTLKTDTALFLEKAIHRTLDYRGQRAEKGGGTEWYVAKIEDVIEIWEFLDSKRLIRPVDSGTS